MNLTVKTLVFVIASALAACSADDDTPIGGGVDNPIDSHLLPIKLVVGDALQTRAADGLLKDNFPSGTDINVAIDNKVYDYQTAGTNQNLTCTSQEKPYFPSNLNSITVRAFYPKSKYIQGWKDRVYTIAENQSTDANYQISDLMFGTPSPSWNGLDANGKVKPTNNAIPLTFKHVLSKIIINIPASVSQENKITQVALKNIKRSVRFNNYTGVADSAHTRSDNNSTNIILYNNSTGTYGDIKCAAVIPPQTISSGINFIAITTTNKTIYYKLANNTTFQSGKTYQYTITPAGIDVSKVKVGHVICSNGTVCAYSERGNRTPVAVIAYLGSNTGNTKYNHGLAVALNTTGKLQWATKTGQYHSIKWPAYSETSPPVEDGSIYRNSQNTDDFPLFKAAFNYCNTFPPNSSGWFLPSVYQWQSVVNSIGSYDKIKSLFKSCGSTVLENGPFFSTCTQGNESFSCGIRFTNTYTSGYGWSSAYQTNALNCLAMLAF